MDIKQKIVSLSKQAGACSIGFADIVEVSPEWQHSFDSMVREGRHGTMAFMERNSQLRANPALLLDGAKTLISLAFSYDKGPQNRHSRIASYVLVQDYHIYLRQLLAPVITFLEEEVGAQCRICVDSAPVAERYWALRTGVGLRGRNQQLMVPGVGARVFLCEILTTASIQPDPIVSVEGYADVCVGCDRCVRACPNGALEDPEKFDARRCVSYITIEHRGDLPQGVKLAGKIYGCDICLDACPYNNINLSLGKGYSKDEKYGKEEGENEEYDKENVANQVYGKEEKYGEGNSKEFSLNSVNKENFYSLQQNTNSPFQIDTDILSLTTQDIENMASGQYRRLTKKSAMSRCPLSQLKRNL